MNDARAFLDEIEFYLGPIPERGDQSYYHRMGKTEAMTAAPQIHEPAQFDRLLAEAIALAARLHAGTVDKAGAPYILHPLRVMQAVDSDEDRIAAVLHDCVEDCGISLHEINAMFGRAVSDAIDALTRREDESYEDFVLRCKANPIARRVKLADLEDNMNLDRLGRAPTVADLDRNRKYAAACYVLQDIATPEILR